MNSNMWCHSRIHVWIRGSTMFLEEALSRLRLFGTWIQCWIHGSNRVLEDPLVYFMSSSMWCHSRIHVWIRGSTMILEEASSRLRLFGTTPCAFYNTKKSLGCGRKACWRPLAVMVVAFMCLESRNVQHDPTPKIRFF